MDLASSFTTFAPGRVELLGNHTDYNEGVVLSAALDLGISAQGSPRTDGQHIFASDGNAQISISGAPSSFTKGNGWADYPAGVTKMLADAGFLVEGFEIRYASNLPAGAGLSSSAALEVATGAMLRKMFGYEISPMELAKICRKAENDFVGVKCGLLDQASSIFGRKNHAVFLDCRAESVDRYPLPEGVALLIVQSGVSHSLVGGEYNDRREACFEAARQLGVPALRDATSAMVEGSDLPDVIKRRALHITGENERVLEAVKHMRAGRAADFGRLMTASHESSRVNFENSTPELDALVAIAIETPGVYGARLTGGGFGGAIVALVDEPQMAAAGVHIVDEYHKRTGHRARAITCTVGDGAIPDA